MVLDSRTPEGRVRQIEHWSGQMDAIARPNSFGIKLRRSDGAPLDKNHLAAIEEYEAAVQAREHANLVADPHWIRKAETRLRNAKQRLQDVQ